MLYRLFSWIDPADKSRGFTRWWQFHAAFATVLTLCVGAALALSTLFAVRHFPHHNGGVQPAPITAPTIHTPPIAGNTLPAHYSLNRYIHFVVNQGVSFSCVGQTVAQMVQIAQAERHHSVRFSAGFIFNQVTHGVQEGITYQAAFGIATSQGDAPFSVFPWDGQYAYPQPDPAQIAAAYPYRFNSWGGVYVSDRITIEAQIAAGRPLAFAAPWYTSLANFYGGSGLVTAQSGTFLYWHSVTIYAYDSAGVWIVNSFGKSWGHNGRAHLSWSMLANSGGYIVVANPAMPLPPKVHRKPLKVRFEAYRLSHRQKPLPFKEHGRLTWAASILKHHPKLRGIVSESWAKRGRFDRYTYAGGVVTAWPREHGRTWTKYTVHLTHR